MNGFNDVHLFSGACMVFSGGLVDQSQLHGFQDVDVALALGVLNLNVGRTNLSVFQALQQVSSRDVFGHFKSLCVGIVPDVFGNVDGLRRS